MRRKEIRIGGFILLLVLCSVYLYFKGSFAIYASDVDGGINVNIAKWNIKVNGTVITSNEECNVDISDIIWESSYVDGNKAAPGGNGYFNIVIDPMDTDVSIRYDIDIIDSSVEPDKILTVTSVSDSTSELVKTSATTYTGIISLTDILASETKNIRIDLLWLDDKEIEFDDNQINSDDYLVVNFTARQYQGEYINPYTGD